MLGRSDDLPFRERLSRLCDVLKDLLKGRTDFALIPFEELVTESGVCEEFTCNALDADLTGDMLGKIGATTEGEHFVKLPSDFGPCSDMIQPSRTLLGWQNGGTSHEHRQAASGIACRKEPLPGRHREAHWAHALLCLPRGERLGYPGSQNAPAMGEGAGGRGLPAILRGRWKARACPHGCTGSRGQQGEAASCALSAG